MSPNPKPLLLKRKKELLKLSEDTEDARKPVTLDQQSIGRLSRMDAMQGQAMAIEVEQRRKRELIRIEQALERIEEDEYGYCLSCGDEIEEKRLKLDPAVSICIKCAKN